MQTVRVWTDDTDAAAAGAGLDDTGTAAAGGRPAQVGTQVGAVQRPPPGCSPSPAPLTDAGGHVDEVEAGGGEGEEEEAGEDGAVGHAQRPPQHRHPPPARSPASPRAAAS